MKWKFSVFFQHFAFRQFECRRRNTATPDEHAKRVFIASAAGGLFVLPISSRRGNLTLGRMKFNATMDLYSVSTYKRMLIKSFVGSMAHWENAFLKYLRSLWEGDQIGRILAHKLGEFSPTNWAIVHIGQIIENYRKVAKLSELLFQWKMICRY
jgi:hypothetical protein